MGDDKEQEPFLRIPLPGALASDLRGRQSVRTTFRLSARTIDAVSIVATHLGIKQKSLFDHLIEDIQSLSAIADKIAPREPRKREGVQKTYVISRKSLLYLDQISREYNMPRDALVEYSVQRLLPIIAKEREKHNNRKKILNDIRRYVKSGQQLLAKSEQVLGEEDPVLIKLKTAVEATENTYRDIDSFIEKGSIIEDY
jgi:predicted transcriptional regulator